MKNILNKFFGGLFKNSTKHQQPEGTYTFALNSIKESNEGDSTSRSNEESNEDCFSLTEGFIPLGKVYIGDNEVAILSTSLNSNVDEIGVVDENCNYIVHVRADLGFKVTNQIDITYRLRRGCNKTIYWVDGKNNPPMSYDFNSPESFKSGGVWNKSKFFIEERYNVFPEFTDIDVLDSGGELLPGSYNVGIQYVDESLNATPIIYTSSAVNIYNDSLNNNYLEVEGSVNSEQDAFKFPTTSKAIKVVSTVDLNYKYYRLVFIEFNSGTGFISGVKYSQNIPTTTNTFIYTGSNYFTLGEESEILAVTNRIASADSIEQIDNRLIIANTTGQVSNLCEIQSIVSKINIDLVVKEVVANSVVTGNTKSPTNHFEAVGYMPGEIYSIGFVPVFEDNTEGPVYHIPGKNIDQINVIHSPGPNTYPMSVDNISESSKYIGNNNCSSGDYWGTDSSGDVLEGSLVRHHRFPYRSDIGVQMVEKINSNTTILFVSKIYLDIEGTIDTPCTQEQVNAGTCSPLTVAEPFSIRVSIEINGVADYYIETIDPANFFDPSTTATIELTRISAEYFTDDIVILGVEEQDSTGAWISYVPGTPSEHGLDYTTSLETIEEKKTVDDYKANVYGIKLSNIDLSAMNAISDKKIIGYHIVRNEREEKDKTILDSAVLTPCVNSDNKGRNLWGKNPSDTIGPYHRTFDKENLNRNYIANGLLSPNFNGNQIKEVYGGGDLEIGSSDFLDDTRRLSKQFYGIIHPEHKFNGREYSSPSRIRQEGLFSVAGRAFDSFIYQDVQNYSSYDSKVHKDKFKDDDGISLRGGARDSRLTYTNATVFFDVDKSNIKDISYLDALGEKSYTGVSENIWNLSADNKTGILRVEEDMPESIYNKIPYVYLERDIANSYQDFRTRPYYKITHKLQTEEVLEVFEGDTYIAPMRYSSSMMIDTQPALRIGKQSVWKIIIGVVALVIVAVVSIWAPPAGAAIGPIIAAIAATTAIVAPFAISLISSGIKEQNIIKAYQEEYIKGLKECLIDADTFQGFKYYPSEDDEMQWFQDTLTDLWFESKVNISLRNNTVGAERFYMAAPGKSDGYSYMDHFQIEQKNVINFGGNYSMHLLMDVSQDPKTELGRYFRSKILNSDESKKDNRAFGGVPKGEIYALNADYDRMNKQKVFFHLGVEYDCCSDCNEDFPHRVWYSEQSFQEELTDHYKTILPNNYRDIEGETGRITDLFKMDNNLYIHTEEALWHLPQNYQEKVTGQLTTYIGTGDFFGIPPRKILDDEQNSGGTRFRWATNKNKFGVFFISDKTIYRFDGKNLNPILGGLSRWFQDNLQMKSKSYFQEQGNSNPDLNNPSNPSGVGFISVFDPEKDRVIFTKKDFIDIVPVEPVEGVTCLMGGNLYVNEEYNYILASYQSLGWTFLQMEECQLVFFKNDPILGYQEIRVTGDKLTLVESKIIDSSWTLSYDPAPVREGSEGSWVSWHSYLPRFYFRNNNKYFSSSPNISNFWRHNVKGSYQNFYRKRYPFILEFVSTQQDLKTKIWESLLFLTEASKFDDNFKEFKDERFITFNKALFYNSRQSSGILNLVVKDLESPDEDYLLQQVQNLSGDSIIIDKNEKNWAVNELRDYVVNQDEPLFNKNINALQNEYYIDKKVNDNVIDINKDWYDIESFRDKYLVIRLVFDTFDDVKLIFTDAISQTIDSER